jgi:hypothetical protein
VTGEYKTRFFRENQEGFAPHFPESDLLAEMERSVNAQPVPDLAELAIGGASPPGSSLTSEGSHALRAGLPQTSRDLRRRITIGSDSASPSRTVSPDIVTMLGPGGGGSINRMDSAEVMRALPGASADSGGGEGEPGAEPYDEVALAYSLTGRTVRARALAWQPPLL